jgi:hypothetical protein
MWKHLFNQITGWGFHRLQLRSIGRPVPALRLIISALSLVIVCAVILMRSDAEGQPAPFAAPAAPGVFYLAQPDGSKIGARARGDERVNWMETADGYTIEKATNGFWYYVSGQSALSGPSAEDKRNGFVLTDVQAHLPPPESLPRHIRPPVIVNAPKNGGS